MTQEQSGPEWQLIAQAINATRNPYGAAYLRVLKRSADNGAGLLPFDFARAVQALVEKAGVRLATHDRRAGVPVPLPPGAAVEWFDGGGPRYMARLPGEDMGAQRHHLFIHRGELVAALDAEMPPPPDEPPAAPEPGLHLGPGGVALLDFPAALRAVDRYPDLHPHLVGDDRPPVCGADLPATALGALAALVLSDRCRAWRCRGGEWAPLASADRPLLLTVEGEPVGLIAERGRFYVAAPLAFAARELKAALDDARAEKDAREARRREEAAGRARAAEQQRQRVEALKRERETPGPDADAILARRAQLERERRAQQALAEARALLGE